MDWPIWASRFPNCPSTGAFTFRFSSRPRTKARLFFIFRMFSSRLCSWLLRNRSSCLIRSSTTAQLSEGGLVIFLSLQVIFAGQQVLLIQAFVLPETAFLLHQFLTQADTVLFQPEMFLLHAETGVAKFVFLIGQVGFALQDADVQERVTEAEDHVARPHLRPFLDQAFFDAPTLDGVKIDDTIRQYLAVTRM